MQLLLISANTEKVNMPTMPVGLALVAAAARQAGHDVRLLDLMFAPDALEAVRSSVAAQAPDAIGISVRNIDDQERERPRFLLEQVRPVVAQCRAACTAPIILGGAGYSIFPQAALRYLGAELGVAGDGELAFVELLHCLAAGEDPTRVPGVHAADGRGAATALAADLDALPLPGDELWRALDPATPELWVPVQTRRGCPNDCSYCSTALIQGRAIRARSPERVAEHVARIARAGLRRFYFVDNSFNIPAAHALELCRCLARLELQLSWRCILYPQRVSAELVAEMRRAGCVEVALGFESGCERVLRALNKRFSVDDVRHASELLARHGIRRMGFLLLGGPGETRASVEQSLAFAASLQLEALRTTVGIRIYPGTALARTALAEGLIDAADPLLVPRFYLAPGLAPWIHERVQPGVSRRPEQSGS